MAIPDWAFIVLLILIFLLTVFVIQPLIIARHCPKVIKIFRDHSAVGEKNAKFIDELGLQQRGFVERMWRGRDYKPRALQLLMQINVIRVTDEGKIYLSEPDLAKTKWGNC
jgi:hypothetical protein